jgi:hypothetical protein
VFEKISFSKGRPNDITERRAWIVITEAILELCHQHIPSQGSRCGSSTLALFTHGGDFSFAKMITDADL